MLTGSVEVVRERSRRVTRPTSELLISGDIERRTIALSLEKLHHSELRDNNRVSEDLAVLPRASRRPPLLTFRATGLLHALDEIPSDPRRPDPRAKSAESSTFNSDVGRGIWVSWMSCTI